jgi:protein-L-isoaspartate O-methyltransferase
MKPVHWDSSHCTFRRGQHAFAIENLLPFLQPGAKVLDLGSSSGYLCAAFYHLIEGNGGYVVGLEHIPEILEWSKENIFNGGLSRALESGDIEMLLGDVTLGE